MQGFPSSQPRDLDDAVDESGWDALDLAREETSVSLRAREDESNQLSPIERELEMWRDIIPMTKDVELDVLDFWKVNQGHRHLRYIDRLMARTACLVARDSTMIVRINLGATSGPK